MRLMSLRRISLVAALGLVTALAVFLPGRAAAAAPETQTFFICPSVSVHNPNGMWVIGYHGGYYVTIPTQGSTGSKVFLTIPVQVVSQAQIPAGWALYNSLPNYPNFVGMAVLLQEGIEHWLDSPAGWSENDLATVMAMDDGSYVVHDLTIDRSITISSPIPLASAAVW